MSKNLKQRIEDLMTRTESSSVLENCKQAISKFNEYSTLNLPHSVMEKMEDVIAEDFISNLQDNAALLEFSDIAINNLGVRKSISELRKIDTSSNLPLRYVLEKMEGLTLHPEWLVYEQFISSLQSFDFEPQVLEAIQNVKSNASKYAEDIKIHRAVYEAKQTRSNYIIPTLQKEIDGYLSFRTPSARAALLEKLNKYLFDPTVKKLYNIVVESAKTFEIAATSNDAVITKVYSPVFVANENEFFVVNGRAFRKQPNDVVVPLSEEETQSLPEGFMELAAFINQPSVEISEAQMKIFSRDKKVVITESVTGDIKVKVNEKEVNSQEFAKIYMNSGIFNNSEIQVLRAVNSVLENWSSIYEIDYVKTIHSKANPHRRADVFRCGSNIHLYTTDGVMKESLFLPNCTAHQARNRVMEFVNYDLSLTFQDMMTPEKRELLKLENIRTDYMNAISYLEEKKSYLENQPEGIRNHEQVLETLEAIGEEIAELKSRYFDNQCKINNITKLAEGVGANVGDTVEFSKKKQK
jgi:hypothetical protein